MGWPTVPLGEVLTRSRELHMPLPDRTYREITMRLWGKGVALRREVSGSEIAGTKRFVAREGQFIVSRIDARNGALGVVPPELDQALVSNDFPVFDTDRSRVIPGYLSWLSKTPGFVELCKVASEGTTNRVRLKEDVFLGLEVPLPPLAEQQRIVARIEEVAGKVKEAKRLREQSSARCNELTTAATSCVFKNLAHVELLPIRALGVGGENPIQTGPFGAQLHRTEFVEDGVPVLNVGNVWPEGLRLDSLDHVTSVKAVQLARYAVKAGDLLFARSGATLGKVCVVPEQCDGWLMTGHLFRVRFDPTRVSNLFAFAALRGDRVVRDRVFGFVRGATRPGFNTTLLGSVELPIPPLDVQQRVVTYLDRASGFVTGIRSLHKRSGAELDALLPAVLDCAFKGGL